MRLFFIILLASSCTNLEPVDMEAYYDMDSLINKQYSILKNSGAEVRKLSSVDGVTDTAFITPDTTQWLRELSVFQKANINKPLLRGAYDVKKEQADSAYVITYTAKKPGEVYVKYLRVIFDQEGSGLRRIEARVAEENPVYGSTRRLEMSFRDVDGSRRIESYEIEGAQKMILKDTVTLNLVSNILYD